MESMFISTPFLTFPQGGRNNPFPRALLRRSGYAKARGKMKGGKKSDKVE
jgi:hypothetical protein